MPPTPSVRQPPGKPSPGSTIEILDEDLEIMRETALYNDYLGVNNYQCRFLGRLTTARTTCTTT